MPGSNLTGPWGEALAAAYLRKKRYTLVACNYRCRFGEVDLIVQDRKYVVFVEVKLRSRGRKNDGVLAVNFQKQQRLIRAARCYLGEYPTEMPVRFDIVEITGDGVFHLPNAFEGSEW